MDIKRILTFVDEMSIEAGQRIDPPLRKVAVAAIVDNPFAGRFERDLSQLTDASVEIGRHICGLAVSLLAPHKPESYGKAAIIGINGEQEHGVAMLTTVFGNVMREAAGGGKAWISSLTKRAAPGRRDRHSAGAQGRALRALALRRHHDHAAGRAAAGRDRGDLRLREPRPAEPSRRRACGERDIKGLDGLT